MGDQGCAAPEPFQRGLVVKQHPWRVDDQGPAVEHRPERRQVHIAVVRLVDHLAEPHSQACQHLLPTEPGDQDESGPHSHRSTLQVPKPAAMLSRHPDDAPDHLTLTRLPRTSGPAGQRRRVIAQADAPE
jgi:hypothetical protein